MISTVSPNLIINSSISIASLNQSLYVSISGEESDSDVRIKNNKESEIILRGLHFNIVYLNFEIVDFSNENFYFAQFTINYLNKTKTFIISFKQLKEKLFMIPSFQWNAYYPFSSFFYKIFAFTNYTESITIDYALTYDLDNVFVEKAIFNLNDFNLDPQKDNFIRTLSISTDNMFKQSNIDLISNKDNEEKFSTLNYYDIIKWNKFNEIWLNYSNSSIYKYDNYTIGFVTALGEINMTGEIILKNDNFLGSDILDFGIENKGENISMYIKYTNPLEYPIDIFVFLSEYPISYYDEELHYKKMKKHCLESSSTDPYNYLSNNNKMTAMQKCCFLLKKSENSLEDDYIKQYAKEEYSKDDQNTNQKKSAFTACMEIEIPEIKCSTFHNQKVNDSQIQKEIFKNQMCSYKYDFNTPQFKIGRRNHFLTVNKNSSQMIGPITFSPTINELNTITNYLIVKNKLSFISIVKLMGICGNGILELSDLSANLDDPNNKFRAIEMSKGIRNTISINIKQEELIENIPFLTDYFDSTNSIIQYIEKFFQNYKFQVREIYYMKFNLKNIGNIPLNISKIFLDNALCQRRDFSINQCTINDLKQNESFIFEIKHLLDLGRVLRNFKLVFIVNNFPQTFNFQIKISESILSKLRYNGFLD